MERIARTYEYDVRWLNPEKTVVVIGKTETLKQNFDINMLQTRVFTLRYSSVAEIAEALKVVVDQAKMSLNPRTNQIVITGSLLQLENAAEIIAQMDHPMPQVNIEARMEEILESSMEELGLVWGSSYSLAFGPGFSIFPAAELSAKLNVLHTQNKAVTLAQPNATCLDSQQATIFIGDKYPVARLQIVEGKEIWTVEYAEIGTKLVIKPRVNKENIVTVSVKAEVSSILEYVDLSQAGKYPVSFYSAGWKDLSRGSGEVNLMLYYALKNLPALIIDPNIVNDIIYLNIAVWGLGVDSWVQDTLFEIPFRRSNGKNRGNEDGYRHFADILQLYIYYTAGWIADVYFMIEYDQMPLLPGIILHHPNQNEDWSFLKGYFAQKYKDSYEYIYGKQFFKVNGRVVSLRETKAFDIPALCLNFSHGASELIKERSVSFAEDCIRDSMESWLTLRGMNPEIGRNLDLLRQIREAATHFDIPYLNALKQSYITLPNSGEPEVGAAIQSLNQRIAWLK
ncbi:MAG: hypothetical protein K6U03_07915 [Firmicutes bacterium]|nr:hypothetical protein [Bacillota bacterium]